jgi:hypothetical protein
VPAAKTQVVRAGGWVVPARSLPPARLFVWRVACVVLRRGAALGLLRRSVLWPAGASLGCWALRVGPGVRLCAARCTRQLFSAAALRGAAAWRACLLRDGCPRLASKGPRSSSSQGPEAAGLAPAARLCCALACWGCARWRGSPGHPEPGSGSG